MTQVTYAYADPYLYCSQIIVYQANWRSQRNLVNKVDAEAIRTVADKL